ncbi:MAG: hypothetical protein CSA33_06885 [Desulfobulbus propionicus]|nr:MAG: hypothetical protein CSA33_06885 [Desulfobulbus propionicus]
MATHAATQKCTCEVIAIEGDTSTLQCERMNQDLTVDDLAQMKIKKNQKKRRLKDVNESIPLKQENR